MKRIDIGYIKSTFTRTGKNSGIGCLASVMRFFGVNPNIEELVKKCGADIGTISLHSIMEAAQIEGFRADGYEGEINFLKEFVQPVILPGEKKEGYDYCFLLYGWQDKKFIIGDPQWGIVEYRENELYAFWKSKTFLLIRPAETVHDK
jgi:ATP-binding cassette, subfamily C, bacteriocin exporter